MKPFEMQSKPKSVMKPEPLVAKIYIFYVLFFLKCMNLCLQALVGNGFPDVFAFVGASDEMCHSGRGLKKKKTRIEQELQSLI